MRKSSVAILVTCALILGITGAQPTAQAQQEGSDSQQEPRGTNLAQSLDPESRDLPRVAVDSLTDFSRDGGSAIAEPGTERQEQFTYAGIGDTSDVLVDVVRYRPLAHAQGVFVWSVPGSALVNDLEAATSGPDARIKLRDIGDFSSTGGHAWLNPGTTAEEQISYSSIDLETQELVGITRGDATGHRAGTFIQAEQWTHVAGDATADEPEAASDPSTTTSSSAEDTFTSDEADPAQALGSNSTPSPTATATSGEGPSEESFGISVGVSPQDDANIGSTAATSASTAEPQPTPSPSSTASSASESAEPESAMAGPPSCADLGIDCTLPPLPPSCADLGIDCTLPPLPPSCADLGIDCTLPPLPPSCADLGIDCNVPPIPDPCDPNDTGQTCVQLINEIIRQTCDPHGTGQTCQQVLNDLITDLCGSSAAQTCAANLLDGVNDLIANVCEGTTSTNPSFDDAVTNCTTKVVNTVNSALTTACQSTNAQTCATNLITKIDTTVLGICNNPALPSGGSVTGLPTGVGTCVVKVLGTVNLILTTACQSTDGATCVTNLLAKVTSTVATVCGMIPVANGGAVTGLPPGVGECVLKALGTVNLVLTTACQSTDPAACAANLIDKIDDTLWGLCTAALPGTTTFTTTGLPPGVATCLRQGVATVEAIFVTACQSTNAQTCATNLITKIDTTVGGICNNPALPSGGSVTGLPTGVGTCVVKVLGTVNLILTTACQSTDGGTCVANLLDKINDLAANLCEGAPATAPSTDSGVTNCTTKVVDTVNTALMTACQSTNAQTCATNLITKIDTTVLGICNNPALPSGGSVTGLPTGVGTCVVKVLGTVNLILTTACQSTDGATCVANLLAKVTSTVATVCGMIPVANGGAVTGLPPGVGECVLKALGTVNLVLTTACQSTDPAACATNLIDKIDDTLWGLCTAALPGTTTFTTTGLPPGVATCLRQGVATVESIFVTACQSTNAQTCATNLIDKIDDTLWGLCTAALPGTTTFTTTGLPPGVATCLRQGVATVESIFVTACQSTDPATCVETLSRLLEACAANPSGCVPLIGEICAATDGAGVPVPGVCDPVPPPPDGLPPCAADPVTCVPFPPVGCALNPTACAPSLPLCSPEFARTLAPAFDGLRPADELELGLFGVPESATCSDDGTFDANTTVPTDVVVDVNGGIIDVAGEGAQRPPEDLGPADPTFNPVDGTDGSLPGLDDAPIGHDDRQRANTRRYSFSAVAHLSGLTTDGGSCSGFLVGMNTVVTAAHCHYDYQHGRWMEPPLVYPGRSGPNSTAHYMPYECRVTKRRVSAYYIYHGYREYDWAMMKIRCQDTQSGQDINSIDKHTGWFAYSHRDAGWRGFEARISGYPSSKIGAEFGTQWWDDDRIIEDHGYLLRHRIDSGPGQSGSPTYRGLASCGCSVALGIHVAPGRDDQYNLSVRILPHVFRAIYHFKRKG